MKYDNFIKKWPQNLVKTQNVLFITFYWFLSKMDHFLTDFWYFLPNITLSRPKSDGLRPVKIWRPKISRPGPGPGPNFHAQGQIFHGRGQIFMSRVKFSRSRGQNFMGPRSKFRGRGQNFMAQGAKNLTSVFSTFWKMVIFTFSDKNDVFFMFLPKTYDSIESDFSQIPDLAGRAHFFKKVRKIVFYWGLPIKITIWQNFMARAKFSWPGKNFHVLKNLKFMIFDEFLTILEVKFLRFVKILWDL